MIAYEIRWFGKGVHPPDLAKVFDELPRDEQHCAHAMRA